MVGDASGRMQREAAGGEAQGCAAHGLGGIGQQPPHPLSGALAGGQLPLHGGGRKGGLQGLRLGELVEAKASPPSWTTSAAAISALTKTWSSYTPAAPR